MSITPWPKGATGPAWTVAFKQPPTTFGNPPGPFDLTDNGGITTTILDNQRGETDASYSRLGQGAWRVTDAANGLATYTLALADVNTEGDFSVVFSVVGSDGLTYKWPPQRFVVTNRSN